VGYNEFMASKRFSLRGTANGFTLIELLFVIAIIGLLGSIIFSSLNGARIKARDVKRIADLRQLKLAILLYIDKFDTYPPDTCAGDTSYSGGGANCLPSSTGDWHANSGLRVLVTNGFLPSLPKDPVNNSNYNYFYEPTNSGSTLVNTCIRVRLEKGSGNTYAAAFFGPAASSPIRTPYGTGYSCSNINEVY